MSEVDLQRLIADLQQGDNQKAADWKKVVCEIINRYLQDLDKIAEHSSKKQYDCTLVFLCHVLNVCPELFATLPSSLSTDLSGSSQQNDSQESNEEKQSYQMTTYVVCHLLRILGHPGCLALHEKACSMLPALLVVIKPRDPFMFQKLTSEFMFCLGDLAMIHEEFYEKNSPEYMAVLQRFSSPTDCSSRPSSGSSGSTDINLTHPPIIISGPEACELLQASITEVLSGVALDVCQFAANMINSLDICGNRSRGVLWASLGCQLEYGEVHLKKVTLALCSQLVKYSGLPSGPCLDYFISCVCALVQLLSSGFNSIEGDYDGLENNLSTCLEVILENVDNWNLQETKLDIVQTLLEGLSQSIIVHGLALLRTDCLKTAVCRGIYTLTCHITQDVSTPLIWQEQRQEVTNILVQALGSKTPMQFCVPCIQQAVLLDFAYNYSSIMDIPEMSTSSTLGNPDQPDLLAGARSHPSSGSSNGESVQTTKTPTLALLQQQFTTLCTCLQKYTTQENPTELPAPLLEGLRVIIEAVGWSLAIWRSNRSEAIGGVVCVGNQRGGPRYSQDLGDWLAPGHLVKMCTVWKIFLQTCVEKEELQASLSESYLCIVNSIGALLFVQDLTNLSSDVLNTFAWILSLPWLSAEMSWLDLKLANNKDIAHLSSVLADKLDGKVVFTCMCILAMLPKEVASKWRTHVLKVAMGDSREEVRAAVVKAFPFLLYHCGPSTNHLVYDILQDVLADKSETVLLQLAQVLGPLACVVSRKAALTRPVELKMKKVSYEWLEIDCVTCNKELVQEGKEGIEPQGRPRHVDPSMFVPFLQLLSSDNVEVKKAMVASLARLFGHIGVRSNNAATIRMLQMCLSLLQDREYVVRRAFSDIIWHFVGEECTYNPSQSDEIIVSHLKLAAKHAKESNNAALMETVLLTIGQIGRVAEGDLLLVTIVSLVDNVCSPACALAAAVAHQQLQLLAQHKGIKMKQLFLRFGRSICKILVENMHDAQRRRHSITEPMEMIGEVSQLFEFENTKVFLQRTEQFLLPHLVRKASSTASQLIRTIAKTLGDPNHKGPLARNIRYIFCHLVCSCQSDELLRTFTFLESESEWSLGLLLRAGQNLDIELLLYLSTHYEQVLTGIKILNSKLGNLQGSVQEITDEALADLLQPKLLGILVHFDNHLNNAAVPFEEKKQAFESVISLMRLMGPKYITAVRVRVMTTLKIGLNFNTKNPGFAEVCCQAWNWFVRSVEISSLGPMLSQVIVNLQPLLKQMPKQVAEILHFLIVEKENQLHQHFHELYFLPDLPDLASVSTVLKKYVEGPDTKKDLRTQLELLLKGITHESLDIRQLALSKLRNLLQHNQAEMHNLALGSETVDPVICRVATVLLDGCRESDKSVRTLYGECLGQLGAIDPGRLEMMSNRSKDELNSFLANVTDNHFAFELINELAKAFLRAEDRNTQDCVGYSIQELIQVYGITAGGSSSSGTSLWCRFSPEVQETMGPFMQSRYMLTYKPEWGNLPKPIYRSRKGKTFSSWVCTLTGYLASKVQSVKANKVFKSCRGVIKNDAQIALYLLPHVCVQVLLDGTPDEHMEIREEILAVLNHVKHGEGHHDNASDLCHMSAQTVFSVLDHLTKWTRHRVMVLSFMAGSVAARSRAMTSAGSGDFSASQDAGLQCIKGFLEQIPQDVLAIASQACGAYTRALMHFEQFIKQADQVNSQENLDFIQKLYVSLGEPDGVAGITSIKQTRPTLSEQIRAFESTGQLSDASVCYDQAIQLEPTDLRLRQGLLRCRLSLGELHTAADLADGMIAARHQWKSSLNEYRVEAAWRLGQWDKLSGFLKKEDHSRTWSEGLGHLLMAVKMRDEEDFHTQLKILRNDLMGPLSAASMEVGSYDRGYQYIVRLHMLNELEVGVQTLMDFPRANSSSQSTGQPSVQALLRNWQSRHQLVQSSFRACEPILNLRRTVLGLAQESKDLGLEKDIGQCWLQTARVARKCGLVQTAHSSLLSASTYNLPEFCLENAKWLWDRGDYDKAQTSLEKAIELHYPDRSQLRLDDSQAGRDQRLACAKAILLLGRYSEETASWESNAIMRQYREVVKVHPDWEDGYFYSAKYYDKLMTALIETDRPEKKGEFIFHVVSHLLQSLKYGNQYIYQSMPRLLTLWLDYGAELVDYEKKNNKNDVVLTSMRSILDKLNKHMAQYNSLLQPYQFLTAFPQLISRICHAHTDVFTQLKEIIAKQLVFFPQQAMWMLMAVSKSTYTMRGKRCQEIFSRAKSLSMDLNKFLQDATKLTDRLLDLCNRQVEGTGPLSISQHFKPLQRLIDDRNFSPILLPLQSLMTPTLPCGPEVPAGHQPFPCGEVFIQGIEDMVEVLPSLQKPKKITLQGSDGKLYVMLCKPKDDLRKDARLMEFNAIVNKCLRKDPESRRRDLHIRTYTVTPLNEECGLLEWVSKTTGYRHILLKLYKEHGLYTSGKELRSMQVPVQAPAAKKLEMFKTKLLVKHPALFGEWFLKTFPDPTSWYNARLAYARTTAVMSMIGYILGLGDRHGENILLDSTNGDCVHVDFNCLFNKGETFDYPEIVPFRLTHNMVEAMGPTGCEGVFRRACEVTLRVMRDQSDPLMSVLKTFIYDPLVEWSKPARGRANPTDTGEIKNEKAFTHVSNIESRLKGILKNKTKPRGLPLSVDGHVNHLIKEATDENNLSQMYIGWAAYL